MTPLSNQQFTAYVGIDWADTKHDICLQAAGDIRREFDCIPHEVARIDEWAKTQLDTRRYRDASGTAQRSGWNRISTLPLDPHG